MKIQLYTTALLILVFSGGYTQNGSLNGAVTYKNTFNSPMHDSTIVYLMHNNTVVYFDTVDAAGLYNFSNIAPGNYTLKANSYKKPGGITWIDYFIVFANFTALPPLLTGLNKLAADVNASGGVPNAVDALAIQRFLLHAITSFGPYSEWVSESINYTVAPGSITTQNIKMLCRGDCNGSFIPW